MEEEEKAGKVLDRNGLLPVAIGCCSAGREVKLLLLVAPVGIPEMVEDRKGLVAPVACG